MLLSSCSACSLCSSTGSSAGMCPVWKSWGKLTCLTTVLTDMMRLTLFRNLSQGVTDDKIRYHTWSNYKTAGSKDCGQMKYDRQVEGVVNSQHSAGRPNNMPSCGVCWRALLSHPAKPGSAPWNDAVRI